MTGPQLAETLAVYAVHVGLLMMGIARLGPRPVLLLLASALMATWVAGAILGGPERVIAFILIDYAVILLNEVFRSHKRERSVGGLSVIALIWSWSYASGSYINYWTYAAGLNCVVALQLLIGGGMADDLGRRVLDWIARRSPRAANALLFVAV